jgi:toxin YoeB
MALLKIAFTTYAWEDYQYWLAQDAKTLKRINELIESIRRDPAGRGLGKSELLKGNLAGWRSKRIDGANRMVYRIEGETLVIAQLRFHY